MESQSADIVNWFKENKMIVNPDMFQAIIIGKKRRNHKNEKILIDQQNVEVVSPMKLLKI